MRFNQLFLGIRTAINCWQRDPWFFWQALQDECRQSRWTCERVMLGGSTQGKSVAQSAEMAA